MSKVCESINNKSPLQAMAIPQKKHYTIDEYFAQEAVAEYKSQYYNSFD
ncbi:MAG: hypothetical protein RLZZ292_2509 [Bacteroidota bacterium]